MYPFVLFYLFHISIRSCNPVIHACNNVSTSNLKHHISRCDGQVAPGGHINEFAHGLTYNKAEFHYLATLQVSQFHRPFAILDDHPLNCMFQMLYAKVNVPSALTVSKTLRRFMRLQKGMSERFYSLMTREFISVLMGEHLQTSFLFSVLLFIKSRMVNFNHISQTSLSISSIKRYTYLY